MGGYSMACLWHFVQVTTAQLTNKSGSNGWSLLPDVLAFHETNFLWQRNTTITIRSHAQRFN